MARNHGAKNSAIAMFLIFWIVAVVVVMNVNTDSSSIKATGKVVVKSYKAPGERFLTVNELPSNICWRNNGCYGQTRGVTYRCDDFGFENEFGSNICHCAWNCQVE